MPVFTGETYDTRTQRAEQLPDLGRDEGNPDPFTFISSPGSWECIDLEDDGSFTVTSFTRYDVQKGPGANITGEKAAWRWVGPTLDEAEAHPSMGGGAGNRAVSARFADAPVGKQE